MKLNVKKWVEEHRPMFDTVVGQSCQIKINALLLTNQAHLETILATKLGDLINAPEMRVSGEGKYTPPCFTLKFNEGQLVFVIEDTAIRANIHGGINLICGTDRVEVNPI